MKKLIMGLLILGLLFPLIVYAEEKVDKENAPHLNRTIKQTLELYDFSDINVHRHHENT